MECPECECDNPLSANFCFNCGSKLSASAAVHSPTIAFNEKIEKLQRYLPQGITEKILSQKDKLEGERRQVTVMFCDMEGYTPLVDRIDTEDAYRIMDKVYEILIHSVHEFEGTVNEMTGDGIMALFGAPIAIEDAPQRALRAAIAIHRNIARFSAQNKDIGPIRMRIGVHTGLVIVGTLGNDLKVEFKAVGDTVNLASRMESFAEPGTTYVTAATFKLTRKLFKFEIVGHKVVKGKKDSVLVYKVLSAKKDVYRSRLGAERMIYSSMIGRQAELNLLEHHLRKVIDGAGAIINIIGEAGIGKSRLVAEVKKSEAMKRVLGLEGRSVSIGRNLGFHPIIDILKQWAGINHDDSETIAAGKLEIALRKLYHEDFQARLPIVASLMGIKLEATLAARLKGIEGESLEKLIVENVRELLTRGAQLRPLVIIIEDLHWSDTSSIDLLESLFDLAKTQRLLFINVFRPGYQDTGERIIERINEKHAACYVEIQLDPLDGNKSEALIGNMLSHSVLDHALVNQVINRAGGNPYFIEEIVRSMIDEGALTVKNGNFQTTEKISSLIIPNTLNDVLMSRFDQLDEAAREVVLIASVVGRTFLYGIIKDVSEGNKDIDFALSYLKEMQIIHEYQRAGEREYRFKHGLAQETVYFSMLPPKRRNLHLKVATSIEKLFHDKLHEFYGVLSYHFNMGEDFEKAEEYMLMAGHEAMKISASSEALNYYKTAMELYIKKSGKAVEKVKIANLEENIAVAFFNKGNFVEAVNYFDRSLKNYGERRVQNALLVWIELGYNLTRVIKSLYLPSFYKKRPPSDEDLRIMNLKFKLAMSLSYVDINRVFVDNVRNVPPCFRLEIRNAPVYVDALIGLSALFAVTGLSFKLSRKILRYVDTHVFDADSNDGVPKNFYRFIESLHNALSGKWHHKVNQAFIENALSIGDVSYASGYLFWLGYSKLERGDFDEAQKIVDLLGDIGNRYNFEHTNFDFYFLAAKLALNLNQLSKARKHADDAIQGLVKYGRDVRKIEFYGLQLKICVLQEDLDAASKIVRDGDDLISKIGKKAILPNYYGEYLIGKLRLYLKLMQTSISLDHKTDIKHYTHLTRGIVKQNVKHFKSRTVVGRTEAYRLVGKYFWLISENQKALKWWRKSIHEGQALKAEIELSKTLEEVERNRNLNSAPT